MHKLIIGVLFMLITACSTAESPKIDTQPKPVEPVKKTAQLPIIGGIERVYVENIQAPFHARIDTGAKTSSIDVQNVVPFERDGEKWVSFEIECRNNGEKITLEKPIKRRIVVKRTEQEEHRYVVKLKIKIGNEVINTEFSLNDRTKFDYQILIGRNIINGRYLVDVSINNTLR